MSDLLPLCELSPPPVFILSLHISASSFFYSPTETQIGACHSALYTHCNLLIMLVQNSLKTHPWKWTMMDRIAVLGVYSLCKYRHNCHKIHSIVPSVTTGANSGRSFPHTAGHSTVTLPRTSRTPYNLKDCYHFIIILIGKQNRKIKKQSIIQIISELGIIICNYFTSYITVSLCPAGVITNPHSLQYLRYFCNCAHELCGFESVCLCVCGGMITSPGCSMSLFASVSEADVLVGQNWRALLPCIRITRWPLFSRAQCTRYILENELSRHCEDLQQARLSNVQQREREKKESLSISGQEKLQGRA